MDIIQLLPDNVANQIAAGEVIQRPASVIKELVENAIDANATTIKVYVEDAGRTKIQVIDDGCGMSETDARLSFERHATSKIKKADDLFSLHTMGFRGEALASIAAVAQVTLQTRQQQEELGTKLVISGSKVVSQEPVACPVGSNFIVENIFFNIPARRKFLKSNSTEMSNINQVFERMVLVYPNINFHLYNNGQETFRLPATSFRQRIIDVFGKKMNQSLLSVDVKTGLCDISGFVGKPESSHKKGAKQFFFVNGRFMKHAYFHKAVMMAFDRLVPTGEQVSYFLYLNVDPKDIDVNIHPVKTEIKFDNEQAIWQILMAAVRESVGRFSGITQIDFDVEGKPNIPVYNPTNAMTIPEPTVAIDNNYNPFEGTSGINDNSGNAMSAGLGVTKKTTSSRSGSSSYHLPTSSLGLNPGLQQSNVENWKELYERVQSEATDAIEGKVVSTQLFDEDDIVVPEKGIMEAKGKEHFQYNGKYIITHVSGGMMLVDQHRASVRILFEEYMRRLETRTSHTQKLLFPEIVQFPPSYSSVLEPVIAEMCNLGFDITDLGGGSYSVAGLPAGLTNLDALTLVSELVSAAVEYGSDIKEEINSLLSLELAARVAKPYGEILTQDKMDELLEQLLSCETYRYTPDGKTIVAIISDSDMDALF